MLFVVMLSWRNVEASCHTRRRRLPPSTNSAAYQRWVSSTRLWSVAAECITLGVHSTRWSDWLRIAVSAYPTCLRRPR